MESKIRRVGCGELGVRDTDDAESVAIENYSLTQDVRIGCETSLPESEVQNRYRRASHLLFFLRKASAKGGLQADHREETCRFESTIHLFRFGSDLSTGKWTHHEPEPAGFSIHRLEGGSVIPVVAIVEVRKVCVLGAAAKSNVRRWVL